MLATMVVGCSMRSIGENCKLQGVGLDEFDGLNRCAEDSPQRCR